VANLLQLAGNLNRGASPIVGVRLTVAAHRLQRFESSAKETRTTPQSERTVRGRAPPRRATHYNTHGWREGRNPSVGFDTTAYLAANPDIAAAHVNPLLHDLQFGQHESRSAQADGI
jgi:hypothetical protein